ncbi:hypothetical protein B0H10DRAFT_2216666 [Mycena sp. CBHHK59/15]|nr:hypothetical protein B0H10DRAFT_2240514 [Mycena sp. CBHHK59/15]KAJ6619602.1 hypothetical protein B0H10DRAFT_2216666 [Mycena sp. CBHHK59/15]
MSIKLLQRGMQNNLEITNRFHSCVAGGPNGTNATLTTCCTAVGSSPVSANGMYGCPFNSVFDSAVNMSTFMACTLKAGRGSFCRNPDQPNGSSAVIGPLQWNFATGLLLVGVVLGTLSE